MNLKNLNSQIIREIIGTERINKIESPVLQTGQTFDQFGEPIDYLKQVLYLLNLTDYFIVKNKRPRAEIIVADHFLAINQQYDSQTAKKLSWMRVSFLEKIAEVYRAKNLKIRLSSEISEGDQYQKLLLRIKEIVKSDEKLQESLFSIVPEDKRKIPGACEYPLEEIAVILSSGTDIKLGPPYEMFYDNVIRNMSKSVLFIKSIISIYTTPSFPLNCSLEEREGLKKFGITPYKAQSKGFNPRTQRILMDKHDKEQIKEIIEKTPFDNCCNPLADLILITKMAKNRMEDNLDAAFILQDVSYSKNLKAKLIDDICKYILEPLQK